jgi:hypothetical protein
VRSATVSKGRIARLRQSPLEGPEYAGKPCSIVNETGFDQPKPKFSASAAANCEVARAALKQTKFSVPARAHQSNRMGTVRVTAFPSNYAGGAGTGTRAMNERERFIVKRSVGGRGD